MKNWWGKYSQLLIKNKNSGYLWSPKTNKESLRRDNRSFLTLIAIGVTTLSILLSSCAFPREVEADISTLYASDKPDVAENIETPTIMPTPTVEVEPTPTVEVEPLDLDFSLSFEDLTDLTGINNFEKSLDISKLEGCLYRYILLNRDDTDTVHYEQRFIGGGFVEQMKSYELTVSHYDREPAILDMLIGDPRMMTRRENGFSDNIIFVFYNKETEEVAYYPQAGAVIHRVGEKVMIYDEKEVPNVFTEEERNLLKQGFTFIDNGVGKWNINDVKGS